MKITLTLLTLLALATGSSLTKCLDPLGCDEEQGVSREAFQDESENCQNGTCAPSFAYSAFLPDIGCYLQNIAKKCDGKEDCPGGIDESFCFFHKFFKKAFKPLHKPTNDTPNPATTTAATTTTTIAITSKVPTSPMEKRTVTTTEPIVEPTPAPTPTKAIETSSKGPN